MGLIADIHKDLERGVVQLIVEYRGRLQSEAVGLCKDEALAEDLVFRTIERALTKIDTYKEDTNLFGWMRSIMVHIYQNDMKRLSARGTTVLEPDELEKRAGADWSTDEQLLKNSDSEAIRKALAGLDPKYNQVLLMRYYGEFTMSQIARVLQLPLGTVCRRMQIAHGLLAGKLGVMLGRTKKPLAVLAAALTLVSAATAAVATVPALAPVRDVVASWFAEEDSSGTGDDSGTGVSPVQVAEGSLSEHGQDARATGDDSGTGDARASVRVCEVTEVVREPDVSSVRAKRFSIPKQDAQPNTADTKKEDDMNIKKIAAAAFAVTAVAAATPIAQAETISVPEGTTYKLDATSDYSSSTFDMCGGTLDLNGRTASSAGLTFSGTSTSTFTNSGGSATLGLAGGFVIDSAEAPGKTVRFTGGQYTFAKADNKWDGEYPITLEVSGDDTHVLLENNSLVRLATVNGAELEMNIRSGTLEMKGGKYIDLTLWGRGGECRLNVLGGTFKNDAGMFCNEGKVDINISEGTLNLSGLTMGSVAGSIWNQPHALTMTGGNLIVSDGFTVMKDLKSYNPCTVNLNGGLSRVAYIRANVSPNAVSRFTADGGSVKPYANIAANNANFLGGFQEALLGERGLTFDAAYAITVAQPFTNLLDGASHGTIVKTGAAALTLTGALGDGVRLENREGDTVMEGESGAVRVTATAGSVTLADTGRIGVGGELVANGGRITLNGTVDPTTTASVLNGALEINVSTTFASLTLGGAATYGNLVLGENAELTVTGEVTGSLDYSACDFRVTKDAQGKTHIVRDTSPPTTLEIRLDREGATSNATESLTFKGSDTLAVTVGADSTLALSGLYKRGSLAKSGAGAAVLKNAGNVFAGGVTCSEGRLEANPFSAFGLAGVVTPRLTLSGGTVEVSDEAPVTYEGAFEVDAASTTAAVIFKNNNDVTLRSFNHAQGAFIKRGAGKLTIDPQNRAMSTPMSLSGSDGVGADSRTPLTFDDANGAVPTTGYAGFNVAEGELCLANGLFRFSGTTTMIGMPLAAELAAPVVFTVTNADVRIAEFKFYVGSGLTEGDHGQSVRVNLIDSTISGVSALCIGGYKDSASTSPNARVYVGMTNSTCTSAGDLRLNANVEGKTYLAASNTIFSSGGGFTMSGWTESVLVDCEYRGWNGAQFAPAPLPAAWGPDSGWTRFTGGSRVNINTFGGNDGSFKHAVIFDDAIWYADTTVKMRWAANAKINYFVKTEGAGVTIPVDEGNTFRTTVRLEGDGGLIKKGAGTFFFDTRAWNATKCTASFGTTTWDFTGPVDIQEGTLAVTNGAIAATMSPTVHIAEGATWKLLGDVALTNVTISGSGTVEGGTLENPTVKGEWTGGKLGEGPVFAGATTGTMTIDFGVPADQTFPRPLPKNLRVATCPNAGALKFRVTGRGSEGFRAEVKCVGNDIYCTLMSGLMIIVN